MNILLFPPKKIPEETLPKIYLRQDPDPDVFKSWKPGQNSSGAAALLFKEVIKRKAYHNLS
jgi:hypothetical protein